MGFQSMRFLKFQLRMTSAFRAFRPQPQKKQGVSLSGPLSESWTLDVRKGNRESKVVRTPRDLLTRRGHCCLHILA